MQWCNILEACTRVAGVEMERREQKKERFQWVGGTRGLTDDVGGNKKESKVVTL